MELKELLKQPGATVLDVRTVEEFEEGHLTGSINIPLDQVVSRTEEIGGLSRPLILCCRSGNRSGKALQYLHGQGQQGLHNGGGWEEVQHASES